ncbi:unnamed protein product [Cylicocyclus nassatus]|uniref:Uncharacterized protein n=1 Tax=Cylicocyclus nassatus TaxID=53992 RepID=A0AA36MG51_CYLNA|nr:unnamed protein product [Cylicocyclus nassatus]
MRPESIERTTSLGFGWYTRKLHWNWIDHDELPFSDQKLYIKLQSFTNIFFCLPRIFRDWELCCCQSQLL